MKNEQLNICNLTFEAIQTKHVFSENVPVGPKKVDVFESLAKDEWFPINFQWKPIVELNEYLNNQ